MKEYKLTLKDNRKEETFSLTPASEEELKRFKLEVEQIHQKAVSEHPEYDEAIKFRKKERIPEAIKIHSEILSKDPNFLPSLYDMGLILVEVDEHVNALKYLERAEKLCERHSLLYSIRIAKATAKKQLADSISLINPDLASSLYKDAESLYKWLIHVKVPTREFVVLLINYGNLCFSLDKKSKAHDLYGFALEIIRDNPRLKEFEARVERYLRDTI